MGACVSKKEESNNLSSKYFTPEIIPSPRSIKRNGVRFYSDNNECMSEFYKWLKRPEGVYLCSTYLDISLQNEINNITIPYQVINWCKKINDICINKYKYYHNSNDIKSPIDYLNKYKTNNMMCDYNIVFAKYRFFHSFSIFYNMLSIIALHVPKEYLKNVEYCDIALEKYNSIISIRDKISILANKYNNCCIYVKEYYNNTQI